jgi:hypothetical protein
MAKQTKETIIKEVECSTCKKCEKRTEHVGYCFDIRIRTVVPLGKIKCIYYLKK